MQVPAIIVVDDVILLKKLFTVANMHIGKVQTTKDVKVTPIMKVSLISFLTRGGQSMQPG
jgi:hypothetical protein